ncbi:hypothetical protein [Nonomuraea sp. NPDC049784]
MPFAISILGLGIFAQGTSKFMLSDLLPSLTQAGLLVSASTDSQKITAIH